LYAVKDTSCESPTQLGEAHTMLLEAIIIIVTIFIIAIAFYKQTNPEYKILQVEEGDLTKIPPLISELSPIVIRGFKTPQFWTKDDIAARPRLQQIPLIYKGFEPISLADAATNDSLILPKSPSATAELLALESGVQVWAEHSVIPSFSELWYSRALQIRSKALIGEQGLQETTAFLTFIMPTEEDIQVTLLHKKQFAFCPEDWQSTVPSTWTKANTPLVGEIQFIDIIIRKGSLLALPPHWRWACVTITPESPKKPMVVLLELNHPISTIAAWSTSS